MTINGLRIDAPQFSDETKNKIITTIQMLRHRIILPDDTLKGTRFNDNEYIIFMLESNMKEQEVNNNLLNVCELCLIEAAKLDHWYAVEKAYGDNYTEDMEVME